MTDQAQKIKNIVKVSEITRAGDDSGLDSVSQVQYMDKPTDALVVLPYGVSANAPQYSNVIVFAAGGSSQNAVGIPYNVENRFRNLKEGEVQVGNFVRKCSIKFDDDGGITVSAGTDGGVIRVQNENGFGELSDDGQWNLNGNLTVDP